MADVELTFSRAPLTALMGANGCGKTTVLHALACAYAPSEGATDYKFSRFFKPSPDGLWGGSKFEITYNQRLGTVLQTDQVQQYSKASERWTPKYERRPKRYVKYLSIRECIPEVDVFHQYTKAYYTRTEQLGVLSEKIRELAGKVLNRNYDKYHSVKYTYGSRSSIGVSMGALTYSALSMSSGEQRVFNILEAVLNSPKYGLILIDEIDLFLHEDALSKMLSLLGEHCEEKKKQLIFTSHFPAIACLSSRTAVMTLHRTPSRTVVWNGYSIEALRHITGKSERALSVYVEDDVSASIVGQVAGLLKMRQYVETVIFGTATNAYSVGSGLILSNTDITNTLVLTDGDVIVSQKERRDQCRRVITGDDPLRAEQRNLLRQKVRMYYSPDSSSPEEVLHRFVCDVQSASLSTEDMELQNIAREIVNSPEKHGYLDTLIERSGEPRAVCLARISRVAACHPNWSRYTRVLHFWLSRKRADLNLVY